MAEPTAHSEAPMSDFEKTLHEYFVVKAPFQLPANAKEWIVKWSPWITLLVLILLAPAALAIVGFGALVGGVAASVGVVVGPLYYLAFIVLLVQLVVMAISIPKLMRREIGGWQLLFYSTLVNLAYNVLSSFTRYGLLSGIIGAAISAVISFYILFQIRSYYR